MKLRKVILIVVVLSALPVGAGAFFFKAKRTVPLTLGRDQIYSGDYITAGETVDLQGNVDGDVIVAGSKVTIAGAVAGDVIAAASDLTITGEVLGDVRVAAMNFTLAGSVEKNLNAWASAVTIAPTGRVGRNAYAVAEHLAVNGTVEGSLAARGQRLAVGGSVKGDARVEVGARGTVVLAPAAKLDGSLTYAAAESGQLQRDQAATVVGTVRHEPLPVASAGQRWSWFIFYRILSLFGLLVVGLVLVSLVPRYVTGLVEQMFSRQAWLAVAWGLAVLVGGPLLIVALAFTLIGLPLALMLGAAYLIALYGAQVIAGTAIGVWIFQRASQGRHRGSLLAPMVCGLLIFVAVTSLLGPAGWALKILAVLWGVGAIGMMEVKMIREWR